MKTFITALVVLFTLASGISMAALKVATIRTLLKMVLTQQATKDGSPVLRHWIHPARTNVTAWGAPSAPGLLS